MDNPRENLCFLKQLRNHAKKYQRNRNKPANKQDITNTFVRPILEKCDWPDSEIETNNPETPLQIIIKNSRNGLFRIGVLISTDFNFELINKSRFGALENKDSQPSDPVGILRKACLNNSEKRQRCYPILTNGEVLLIFDDHVFLDTERLKRNVCQSHVLLQINVFEDDFLDKIWKQINRSKLLLE